MAASSTSTTSTTSATSSSVPAKTPATARPAKSASHTPPLYIIHGWTYTISHWDKTLALLESAGIKVVMLHVPGLTAPSKKVWTIEEYVAWAARELPDGAIALGHSNGGRILLNLCISQPDKLRHLILLDSAGIYESSARRDVSRSLSKRLKFLKKIPGLTKIWHKVTGASDYARAPENMKKTLTNMLDSDKSLKVQKVTIPTSILWGAADVVTPPRQAEALHAKIPASTLNIYPNWTHAPYISHPAELAKVLTRLYHDIISEKPQKSSQPATVKKTAPTQNTKSPSPSAAATPDATLELEDIKP